MTLNVKITFINCTELLYISTAATPEQWLQYSCTRAVNSAASAQICLTKTWGRGGGGVKP